MNRFEQETGIKASTFRRVRDQFWNGDPLAYRLASKRAAAACARAGRPYRGRGAPVSPETIRAMECDEWRRALAWLIASSR